MYGERHDGLVVDRLIHARWLLGNGRFTINVVANSLICSMIRRSQEARRNANSLPDGALDRVNRTLGLWLKGLEFIWITERNRLLEFYIIKQNPR